MRKISHKICFLGRPDSASGMEGEDGFSGGGGGMNDVYEEAFSR